MLRTAALYGAIVTVFALLAWLSIAFNMLLIGAAWTWVRLEGTRAGADRTTTTRPRRPGPGDGAPAAGAGDEPGAGPAAT